MKTFSCVMLGDDSLVIQCARHLLACGHQIKGISTPNLTIQEQIASLDIPIFHKLDEMKECSFDFLFSVSNSRIIPSWLLTKPNALAINYHNAPLPRYKGVNSTAWAIYHDQKEHGITWHIMTETVDAGDILVQQCFPIEAIDSAASLNTKCHAYALEAFQTLTQQISENRLQPISQPVITSDDPAYKYYGLNRKIPFNGIVQWKSSAQTILRLFRSLDFSHYFNSLGLPKIMVEHEEKTVSLLICKQCTQTEQRSTQQPGTITAITQEGIQVATQDIDLVFSDFYLPNGQSVAVKPCADNFGLTNHYCFPTLSESAWKLLEPTIELIAQHERYWVRRWQDVQPMILPYISEVPHETPFTCGETKLNFPIPETLKNKILNTFNYSTSPEEILLAVTILYFARLNSYTNYSFAYNPLELQNTGGQYAASIASYVPFTIDLDFDHLTFQSLIDYVKKQKENVKKRGPYEFDIFLRYPVLLGRNNLLPLFIGTHHRFQPTNQYPKNTFAVSIQNDGCTINFSANGEMLEALATRFHEVTKTIFAHIVRLTNNGLDNLQAPIYQLDLLSDEEQQVIQAINQTQLDNFVFQEKSVMTIIKEQALKTPRAIAVSCGDRTIIYSELIKRVTKFARALQNNGIKPGTPVGICIQPSHTWLIALLGILESGATLVPLDPNSPSTYLRSILQNTQAPLLIIDDHALIRKMQYTGQYIVYRETDYEDVNKTASPSAISQDAVAYIIHTSGSSGEPKGVRVTHRSLSATVEARQLCYTASCKNLLFLLAPAFDTALAAIFWALAEGGTLTIPKLSHRYGRKYVQDIKKHQISHLICVPAIYQKILQCAKTGELSSVTTVVLGGDYWTKSLTESHREQAPQATLFDEFGATETGIWNLTGKVYDPNNPQVSDINIGTMQIPGGEIFVLDKYQRPVPPDIPGEFYISGPNLALDYHNKPKLTAESFITLSLTDKEKRYYRTKDIGCIQKGNIRLIGRADDRVKVRGYLVEPHQIEKALLKHPKVIECAVKAISLKDTYDSELLAYVVVEDSEVKITDFGLRCFLGQTLPEYMLPTSFTFMDKLPLTQNHKIDRKILPIPSKKRRPLEVEYVKPQSRTEIQLATLWSEILDVTPIGLEDDFYQLGGDSLKVTELLFRIEKFFKVDIKLIHLLASAKLKDLALLIQKLQSAQPQLLNSFLELHPTDTQLDDSIQPHGQIRLPSEGIQSVLLTGVTGFLGIHLLQQLLEKTSVKIYCLIRSTQQVTLEEKLIHAIREYHLEYLLLTREGKLNEHIVLIEGDLEKKRLGLSNQDFEKLSQDIDLIYHNGAAVQHMVSYESLRSPNVFSTVDLLKLATHKKLKHFVYISTLSAVSSQQETLHEDFPSDNSGTQSLQNGYAQSKWTSERLLYQAKERGVPVAIYRPGWIAGHTETGVCAYVQNHFLLLLKGCIQLGYAPNWEITLNLMPVDFVSDFIVQSSLQNDAYSNGFNLHHPTGITWINLVNWINRNFKPMFKERTQCLKFISFETWRDEHLKHIDSKNALYPLLPIYLADGQVTPDTKDLVITQNTDHQLSQLKLQYPEINERLLDTYFQFLQRSKFLLLKRRPQQTPSNSPVTKKSFRVI